MGGQTVRPPFSKLKKTSKNGGVTDSPQPNQQWKKQTWHKRYIGYLVHGINITGQMITWKQRE